MELMLAEIYVLFLVVTVFVTAEGFQSLELIDLEKGYPFQPEPIPVEVQFITQKDQNYPGDMSLEYHASLCGGCYFDNLTARFAVNLANNPWNIDSGDYITVTAKDSVGNVVGTNVVGNEPETDFNFTYSAKYKDLFFDVKTGPAPAFIFALSLTFIYKNTSLERTVPCEPRWQVTPMEHAHFLNFSKGDDSGHLEPIFKTHTKKVVTTRQLQYLRLDYCFGASHYYNITITTVADDQKSGFATYACKKTYNGGKCNTLTPYRDISGGPANFIEMSLDGPQDYGPVVVIIRGDGRYDQPNSYILSASAPY